MSKIYKTGHRKFAYNNIYLYSRTRTYILDRVKVFCIIVGNLFINTK